MISPTNNNDELPADQTDAERALAKKVGQFSRKLGKSGADAATVMEEVCGTIIERFGGASPLGDFIYDQVRAVGIERKGTKTGLDAASFLSKMLREISTTPDDDLPVDAEQLEAHRRELFWEILNGREEDMIDILRAKGYTVMGKEKDDLFNTTATAIDNGS